MKSKVSDAIISHGAYLEECTVENAIVGLRARIGKKTVIRVRRLQRVAPVMLHPRSTSCRRLLFRPCTVVGGCVALGIAHP